MSDLFALSIRQPWAWLIIHAGKDVENREWSTAMRGRILIHAGKTMTRPDFDACMLFCMGLPYGTLPADFEFPSYHELRQLCGGIVGEMTITDCVERSDSPWFCGPYGFVIQKAQSLPFEPGNGRLGFFKPSREAVAA